MFKICFHHIWLKFYYALCRCASTTNVLQEIKKKRCCRCVSSDVSCYWIINISSRYSRNLNQKLKMYKNVLSLLVVIEQVDIEIWELATTISHNLRIFGELYRHQNQFRNIWLTNDQKQTLAMSYTLQVIHFF